MIRLFVNKKKIPSSGALEISWCLPRAVLEEVRKLQNPRILLMTSSHSNPGEHNEERQLVPLNSQMAFVSFAHAGENTIFAQVVTGDSSYEALERHYISGFRETLLRRDGTDWELSATQFRKEIESARAKLAGLGAEDEPATEDESESVRTAREARNASRADYRGNIKYWTKELEKAKTQDRIRGRSDVIDVPKEYFGREWSGPVMDWVNYLWGFRKPKDECRLKHRAALAFTLQPFYVLFLMLMRLTLAVGAFGLLGARRLTLKPVYRPLGNKTGRIWENAIPFWLPDDPKDESILRLFLIPFMPVLFLFAMLCTSGPYASEGITTWLMYAFMWDCIVCAGIAVVIGCFILVAKYSRFLNPFLYLHKLLIPRDTELTDEDIEFLACDTGAKPAGLDDLSPVRRTIRLRILDYKYKHCRRLQD